MTVGELKKALEGVGDDVSVLYTSDVEGFCGWGDISSITIRNKATENEILELEIGSFELENK